MHTTKILTMLAIVSVAANASASQITWGGPAGVSMMNNPNTMADVNSTILAPQATLLQSAASAKASAAALSNSSSTNGEANLITQEVESSIASNISQSITGANGSANSGVFNLGNGQSISYNRANGTTSVTITGSDGNPLNLSFPNIQ